MFIIGSWGIILKKEQSPKNRALFLMGIQVIYELDVNFLVYAFSVSAIRLDFTCYGRLSTIVFKRRLKVLLLLHHSSTTPNFLC
jgi:hypothetical protein